LTPPGVVTKTWLVSCHLRARATIAGAVSALGLLLGHARPAAAQQECQPRDGLSTCIASDNLWTHPGGGRFLSQASTESLPPGATTFGLTPVFLHKPIGLAVSSADPDGTTIYAVENVLATTFLLGVGITDRLSATLAAPVVLYQTGASKADVVGSQDTLPRSAMGDVRFGLRFVVVPREPEQEGFGLSARFQLAAPSGQTDGFTTYGSTTYAPGAVADYRIGDFTLALDLSGRIRRAVTLATATIGPQIGTSLGVGYDILDDGWLSVNLETWALFGLSGQRRLVAQTGTASVASSAQEESGPPHIPMEWMLNVRTAGLLDGRFRASVGGGTFIPTASDYAVTTPAFRTAVSLSYVFRDVEDEPDEEGSTGSGRP